MNAADPQVLQVEDGMYTAFSERQYFVVLKAGDLETPDAYPVCPVKSSRYFSSPGISSLILKMEVKIVPPLRDAYEE